MIYTSKYASPLGSITIASDGASLTGLWFDGQKYYADTIIGEPILKELPIFIETKRWLDLYFSGCIPDFTPPLLIQGTSFRREVCKIMLTIPYGQTMTYGEIATIISNKMGKPKMSAQAVGGAVGHNSISLIIPCHRVVGANGCLTGYAGGIERKIKLLALEKTDITKFKLPKNNKEK